MTVMMMAMTPSLKASRRPLLMGRTLSTKDHEGARKKYNIAAPHGELSTLAQGKRVS
jgi:hypothetical protein